jgi:DNA-binding LacI/PurR family transcriptional regulator
VIVYYDHENHYRSIETFLKTQQLAVPRDIGLAVLDATVHVEGITGVHQNIEQMGISGVDMLVSRLQQGETGVPKVPKVESVEGTWIEGETLRPK